jgi:polyhydroxybutyrate depolymerase
MAFRLGIELEGAIAAIAPVAGALWEEEFDLESPVSLLYITGTEDPLNPIGGGVPGLLIGDGEPGGGKEKPPVREHIRKWTEALDCAVPPENQLLAEGIQREYYRNCRVGGEVVYITLEDTGHHWPGGKVRLPEALVGNSTDLINATDVIWIFFQEHPKP